MIASIARLVRTMLCAGVAWTFLGPAPAAAMDAIDRWNAPIVEASLRFGIPVPWIRRVIRAESGGRTTLGGRPIRSHAGAMGLMQLMPGTWAAMRAAHRLGPNPHDPRDNILAGTAYLRAMYDRFGYPGLFAAYNAGPARYAEHLTRGTKLPGETIAYVAKVGGGALDSAPDRQDPAPVLHRSNTVFALHKEEGGESSATGRAPIGRDSLFYPLASDRRP